MIHIPECPRDLDLPFDTWRVGQRLALRTALHTKRPHVVVNAPTGSGKSTIALGLVRLDARRQAILTATKALQQQYANIAPYLVQIRGMGNYECLAARDQFKDWFPRRTGPVMCDDGPCHDGAQCTLKESGCEYYDVYRSAMAAQAVLPNYSYWLSIRRHGSGLGVAQRLTCDEAHELPEQLMAACRIEIPRRLLDQHLPRKHKQWRQWATRELDQLTDEDSRNRVTRIGEALASLAQIDETWAWDSDDDTITFEPTIPRLLMPLLQTFDDYTTNVYLSATVTPHTLGLLGIQDEDIDWLELKSTFPVERRPVYLVPGARVDYRTMKDPMVVARWIDSMRAICERRDDRSGIIHTVSYSRAWEVFNALKPSRTHAYVVHGRGETGAQVVARYRQSCEKQPSILISPSVMTGFDFPGRLCEFQIIAKLPFPDTRSSIVKARMKATPGYREHLTMQNFIQACGRGMRGETDQCETFVVDEHARWFLRDNRELMPTWFQQAVQQTRRSDIRPPKRLAA